MSAINPIPNIEGFAEQERKCIQMARNDFGEIIAFAERVLQHLWVCVTEVEPEALTSMFFLSQCRKSLWLALLSAVRRHRVQCLLMLRNVTETAALACYALHEPELKAYGHEDKRGLYVVNEKARRDAYKWLDAGFPEHSKSLKLTKDTINGNFAHANLLPAFTTLTIDKNERAYEGVLFDNTKPFIVAFDVWWIGDVGLGVSSLYGRVVEKHPRVVLCSNFSDTMSALWREKVRLQEKIQKGMDPAIRKMAEGDMASQKGEQQCPP